MINLNFCDVSVGSHCGLSQTYSCSQRDVATKCNKLS